MEDLADQVAAALHQYLLDAGRTPRIPRDLPPRVPKFVGREDELVSLMTALRQGQSVGLSALVSGLGGIGKSSLASEAMQRLAADSTAFPGGITWMRCDGRTGLDGLVWVYDQVLAAWGMPLPPDALGGSVSTPAEVREQALRDRLHPPSATLVLLDNVEIDFPLSRALEHLTPQGITLLVTARPQFNLPGLQLVRLDVLESEAAVQLFRERYIDRGGAWDEAQDETAARKVVKRLGWLPLAIELAAARAALAATGVPALAVEMQQPDVLARLQDPLNEAASVRYSIERSLAALTPAQRLRFAALGLPDGPDWPRPVVEALLNAVPASAPGTVLAPAGADLDRLVALSLVTLVLAGSGLRVRLHPLLREVATEEWGRQSGEVRRAGVVGLLAGVQAWVNDHQAQDALTYLLLESDETLMVGALRRAVHTEVALGVVVDTADALGGYLEDGGHWRVGVEVWTLACAATRLTNARREEGVCLTYLGHLHRRLGDHEQARSCYEQALAIAREVGNRQGESANLHNLGLLAKQRGANDDARRLYEQALAIMRKLGNRAGEGRALTSLGILAGEQSNFELARRDYEQALAIARDVKDRVSEAAGLVNLGDLAVAEGDLPLAQRTFDEALLLARAIGNRNIECWTLIELAELARLAGRLSDAGRLLDEARTINRLLGSRDREAFLSSATARLLWDQGQSDAARLSLAQALAIFEAIGPASEAQRVRKELAELDNR